MHRILRMSLALGLTLTLFAPLAPATRTSTAGTVTVTAIAVPSVVCTTVAGGTVLQCTGAITVGADGRSIPGLAGSVSYSGSGSASGDCSASNSGSGSGSWAGIPGATGSTPSKTLSLCTATKLNLLGTQCVSLTVSVRTNPAIAQSKLAGFVVESVTEDSGTKSAFGSICR